MAVSDDDFGQLLVDIAPQLEGYVLQVSGSKELAEHLTGTVITKAWEARHRWSGESFKAWIFTILHNQWADELRSWQSRAIETTDKIDQIARDPITATPGDLAMMREEIRAIWSKLSPEHREVILVVAVRRHSYAEAAEMLGVPEGTVTSRLHRAQTLARRHRAELSA